MQIARQFKNTTENGRPLNIAAQINRMIEDGFHVQFIEGIPYSNGSHVSNSGEVLVIFGVPVEYKPNQVV